jgi:hypothetical protein
MVGQFVIPDNKIVTGGQFAPALRYVVKTATNVIPGRLVTRDTTDAQIKVCTASLRPLGVVSYEDALPIYKPARITDAYTAGDEVPVHCTPGEIVVLYLAQSQTVVAGDLLVPAADGFVAKADALSVTVATGATPVTSTGAQPTITVAGSAPTAAPFAKALMSVTTTSAEKAIIAMIL